MASKLGPSTRHLLRTAAAFTTWLMLHQVLLQATNKAYAASAATVTGPEALKDCLNQNQPHKGSTTWARTLTDSASSKYSVAGVWWSSKSESIAPSQLTLLTHLTLDQKWQLKALCKSWYGPISAIIHFPTLQQDQTDNDPPQDETPASPPHAMAPGAWAGPVASSLSQPMQTPPSGTEVMSTGKAAGSAASSVPPSLSAARTTMPDARTASDHVQLSVEHRTNGSSTERALQSSGHAIPNRRLHVPEGTAAPVQLAGMTHAGEQHTHPTSALGSEDNATHSLMDRPPETHQTTADRGRATKRLVKEAQAKAKAMHKSLDRHGACQIDIMLVHEAYKEERTLAMYPGAVLQNYARLQARTPLVAYVDVDMVVGKDLWVQLQQQQEQQQQQRQRQQQQQGPQQEQGRSGGNHSLAAGATAHVQVPAGPGSPAPGLPALLTDRLSSDRTAWVLPAFVVRGSTHQEEAREADRLASVGTKEELLKALKLADRVDVLAAAGMQALERSRKAQETSIGRPLVARLDRLLASHLPTNYNRWLETNDSYHIVYDEWYEPYVIVDRLGASWSDVRFRGHMRGRAALTVALHLQGYKFTAQPRGFLIHRSHTPSDRQARAAQEAAMEAARLEEAAKKLARHDMKLPNDTMKGFWTRSQSVLSHDSYLLTVVGGAAEQRHYRPSVDAALLACVKALPWWGAEAYKTAKSQVLLAGKLFSTRDWETPAETAQWHPQEDDSEEDSEAEGESDVDGGENQGEGKS